MSVGNVRVPIYRTERRSGPRKGVATYQVADYSDGRRRLRTYADPNQAITEASRLATEQARGELAASQLRPAERASFVRATELLQPTGVSLELAAAKFAEAYAVLGGDRIVEAARDFARRHPAHVEPRTVPEVIEELLEMKARDASPVYLQGLRSGFRRFAADHPGPIADLTTAEVQRWMDGQGQGPQTYMNHRTILHLLFEFAIRRGYRVEGDNPVTRVERRRVPPPEVRIYRPEQLARLLAACGPELLPVVALGAFAGIRRAELMRLDWEDVSLEQRVIQIRAGKAKTGSRRVIPVGDNLAEWLAPFARPSGRVWPLHPDRMSDVVKATLERANAGKKKGEAKVEWIPNGLRHSYGSYRLAQVQDVAKVSFEMGNSPQVVHRHYKELVTEAQAKAWFDLRPAASEVLAPAFRA